MAPRAQTADGTPSRKVFWAEDALDDQFLIRTAVEALRPRPEVQFFEDGDVLLEALRKERPRLVVLDIRMPRLDGIATLRAIRAVPGFHNLPVVMFSTAMVDEEVAICRELKVRDFVQKPAHYAEFAEAVAHVVGGKVRVPPPGTSAAKAIRVSTDDEKRVGKMEEAASDRVRG